LNRKHPTNKGDTTFLKSFPAWLFIKQDGTPETHYKKYIVLENRGKKLTGNELRNYGSALQFDDKSITCNFDF